MQVVVFELKEERYAINTSIVREINRVSNMTNVPIAPKYVKNLINLRGNIISVYNPDIIMGINDDNSKKENIIIIDLQEELIGLMVGRVIEVNDIDEKMIKDISICNEEKNGYVIGTINMAGSLVTVIDINLLIKSAGISRH